MIKFYCNKTSRTSFSIRSFFTLIGLLFLIVGPAQIAKAQSGGFWFSRPSPKARHVSDVSIRNNPRFLVVGGNQMNDAITSIFTTEDKAHNWNIIQDNVKHMINDLEMTDDSVAWVVGDAGYMMHSTNYGVSWDTLTLTGNAIFRDYNGISFTSFIDAIAVGGNESNDSVQTILKTTNAGGTWSIIQDKLGHWLNDVDFATSSIGVAVGDGSTILRTTDGGDNWSPVTVPGLNASRKLMSVNFSSGNIGCIVGGNPRNDSIQTILRTGDGGISWTITRDSIAPMLFDVYFHSAIEAHCVGNNGEFYKTTDAGNSWIPATSWSGITASTDLRVVQFEDDQFGVTAGRFGEFFVYDDTVVGIEDELIQSLNNTLSIFPQPANDQFTIAFELMERTAVRASVYSIEGKKVREVVKEHPGTGSISIEMDTEGMKAGVYLLELKTKTENTFRKLIIK